ncbi:energy transducer TonB [Pararhizobium haloflavum]|uniref:energy transducer TonB n=1 Tax=Pararhizobium haloflavum TaxID=2037914 RepID=UPI000C19028F|nr:energy transducer TonB [Pararhizobium haloflavum]
MTKRIDPLSAEALAVPIPLDFAPTLTQKTLTETLAAAHDKAPITARQSDEATGIIARGAAGMRRHPALWVVAAVGSLAIHLAVSYYFIEPPEPVLISGGEATPVSVLGNAFEDMQSAGEAVDEPTVTRPVEPVNPTTPDTPSPTEATTAETPDAVAPNETPTNEPLAEPSVAAPADTEALEPASPNGVVIAEPPVTAPTPPPEEQAAESPPVTAEPPEPAVEEPVQSAEAVEPLPDPIVDAPIPTPRPEYTPPPPPQRAEPQPAPQPQRQQAQGERGNQAVNQSAGTASGQTQQGAAAQQAQAAARAQAQAEQNAAISNYQGQVRSRLLRALRYPSAARRDRLSGQVQVTFTVSANGSVSGIAVTGSSGSPVLDQAAVQTVQRAAPFPAIPAAAGRNSWRFNAPLAFNP